MATIRETGHTAIMKPSLKKEIVQYLKHSENVTNVEKMYITIWNL